MALSRVGAAAPAFRLPAAKGGRADATVGLEDYRGRWLVLMFYPGDFTFVCPTELRALGRRADELARREAEAVYLSTDSVYTHLAWTQTAPEEGGLGPVPYPMASDPTHAVCRAYGVLDEEHGTAERATVIVDPEGRVRYHLVHDENVGRSVDELLRVLDALRSGQLCPSDWRQGDPHLTR
jgi:peroxiredoxin (alkyl hydroperoxide reductase subunit C)